MVRSIVRLLLLGSLLALVAWTPGLDAQGEKAPDIKEIMGKLNKPTGVYFSIVRELKEEAPMWEEVQAQAKILSQQAAALNKTQPPKGDLAAWTGLVKAYSDNARAAEQAAQRMDKTGAQTALAKMGEPACGTCHKAHRK
jgi:cytochrome c556